MPAKRYASETDLLADMFGSLKPSRKAWVDDFVALADEADQGIVRQAQIDTAAEFIARRFEDPEQTPNLVLWRDQDDPLPPLEWRKAVRRAGELLHREVEVFTNQGRPTAVLILNEEEMEAERRRLSDVMDAVLEQQPLPSSLPRKFR